MKPDEALRITIDFRDKIQHLAKGRPTKEGWASLAAINPVSILRSVVELHQNRLPLGVSADYWRQIAEVASLSQSRCEELLAAYELIAALGLGAP